MYRPTIQQVIVLLNDSEYNYGVTEDPEANIIEIWRFINPGLGYIDACPPGQFRSLTVSRLMSVTLI